MAAVRSKNTAPEVLARRAAHRVGLRFRLHRSDLPGSPDFVLPRLGIAVFVHGCFWHGHRCRRSKLPKSNVEFWTEKIGKNRDRDRKARAALAKLGWRVVVLWQCRLPDLETAEKRISSEVLRLARSGRRSCRNVVSTPSRGNRLKSAPRRRRTTANKTDRDTPSVDRSGR
ncbi:very short patch repair endonuclease [Bradyrhizobium diazoefficiens]|nr:very short patch repair endonuclease [Bradyrhizobium diazoefficiens]WLA61381.1 very short patch repair endonuclease [Bradyrhizobium diazoefficiens]